ARCAAAGRTLGALVSTPHAYGRPACFGGPDAWRDQGARLRTPTDALLRPAPPGSRLKHEAPAAATRPDTTAPRPVQKRFFSLSRGVPIASDSRLRGGRSGPGIAPRLGQPSMADSPPQRIHALLCAIPRPGTTIADSLARLRQVLSKHRVGSSDEPRPGGGGSRQAKHGCFARESGQGEHGLLARHAAHP